MGEQQDRRQSKPEHRERDAAQRNEHDSGVEPRALPHRGRDAERNADRDGYEQPAYGQGRGGRQAVKDLGERRLGRSPLSCQDRRQRRPSDEQQVLLDQRPVEAELRP